MTLSNAPERSGRDEDRWVMTYSGRKFYPFAPKASDVCLLDVAHHLACISRHGGACRRPYSVAEHSVLVSRFVHPAIAQEGLLHDCAEFITGDMVAPIKHSKRMIEFRAMSLRIESAVFEAFGVRSNERTRRAIKSVERRLMVDEVRALMARPSEYVATKLHGVERLGAIVEGWDWCRARREFIYRFEQLFPRYARSEG